MRDSVMCLSVHLMQLSRITDKCYKAVAFDGSEALIPASCYFGIDYGGSTRSPAYWIAEWILKKRNLQYSDKRKAVFKAGKLSWIPVKNTVETIRHIPEEIAPVDDNTIDDLIK